MAHYAFLDKNNIVTEVITGKDENELLDGLTPEEWYGNFRGQTCKRTSYNNNYRKNYASIGYTFNETLDAFIAPKPYQSWILDENTCQWKAPFDKPADFMTTYYSWNEDTQNWVAI